MNEHAADAAAMVEPALHRIVESYLDETSQTVRCACGREATFGRERDYIGVVKRARALAEFVCTGQMVILRAGLLREV